MELYSTVYLKASFVYDDQQKDGVYMWGWLINCLKLIFSKPWKHTLL